MSPATQLPPAESNLAQSALGWEPSVPLAEGLQRTLTYRDELR